MSDFEDLPSTDEEAEVQELPPHIKQEEKKEEHEKDALVLLTGSTGFLGSHCVQRLLKDGYKVRATVRDLENDNTLALKEIFNDAFQAGQLEFVQLLLDKYEHWIKAVEGCKFVLHTAGTMAYKWKEDSEDLIVRPRIEAARHLVKACAASQTVKRVVFSSYIGAVTGGQGRNGKVYTEMEFANKKGLDKISKGHMYAEQEFMKCYYKLPQSDNKFEYVIMVPTHLSGPLILPRQNMLEQYLVGPILRRAQPARAIVPLIDVRDAAELLARAFIKSKAVNQRIILYTGNVNQYDMTVHFTSQFPSYYLSAHKQDFVNQWISKYFPQPSVTFFFNRSRMINCLDCEKDDLIEPMDSVTDMAYSMMDHHMARPPNLNAPRYPKYDIDAMINKGKKKEGETELADNKD